jgi:hypothetical protein
LARAYNPGLRIPLRRCLMLTLGRLCLRPPPSPSTPLLAGRLRLRSPPSPDTPLLPGRLRLRSPPPPLRRCLELTLGGCACVPHLHPYAAARSSHPGRLRLRSQPPPLRRCWSSPWAVAAAFPTFPRYTATSWAVAPAFPTSTPTPLIEVHLTIFHA